MSRMLISELDRHSLQLYVRDKCRMSMSDLAQHSTRLDIRDFAECRCQIWLDICLDIFEYRMSIVDVSAYFTHLHC
ncbi:hypothetical protein DPMN_138386 [Dreissena polymorpha]|uniref:Uncharacterized protein n=1 Tax=Dreissena polymorpha TaxID=45954 RepID=A0A9D4JH87_DREPO|nr:hypothetical protein DPMN_138386 [Dreissena polymorpha]